ncbi:MULTISPECIES: recombination directionality factor [unclassified Streptomyces]|uniref:recombination directionality factor n=1 Tax=Streptomyces sp. NPDC056835 TaxID=3345956 RepID=UPI0036BD3738
MRIFETDPDAKPRKREATTVGRFRSGRQVNGQAVALPTFRITTDSTEVIGKLAELFGGTPSEWETAGEDFNEIITDVDKVLVVIDGPDSLRFDMRLYSRTNQLIHHCDGVESLMDEDRGKPCGCPALMEDRKAYAKSGRGPQPYTMLNFRLADDYGLGVFRFQSNSWTVLPFLDEYWTALKGVGGESLAEFELELVEYTTKKGREVSYRRPAIKVLKPWAEAITDDADTDY